VETIRELEGLANLTPEQRRLLERIGNVKNLSIGISEEEKGARAERRNANSGIKNRHKKQIRENRLEGHQDFESIGGKTRAPGLGVSGEKRRRTREQCEKRLGTHAKIEMQGENTGGH